jgi:sarcosine oxidase subunit gamma
MNTWSGDDPVFCRIAPDTWLVESSLHGAVDLLPAVRAGCGRRSFAVTDVSDAFVTLAVEGAQAPALLARGCGLDLTVEAFGNAACSRTRLAQLPVVVRRVTSEKFECIVDRSSAQWLYDWLQDAAGGLA